MSSVKGGNINNSISIDGATVGEILDTLAADATTVRSATIDFLNRADATAVGAVTIPDLQDAPAGTFSRSYAGTGPYSPSTITDFSYGSAPDKLADVTTNTVNVTDASYPGAYNGYTYTEPSFSAVPDIEDIKDPTEWDATIDVTVPAELSLTSVKEPSIKTVDEITIPEISVASFTSTVPTFTGVRDVNSEFEFTETQYTSDVLTDVDTLMQSMLAGGVGIPEAIWDQIWERSGVQVDNEADKLINEINSEWAGRGFSLPQGVQVAQVAEARKAAFDKKAELARDNAIAYSQEEIKNLQFAVQQGIAFESLRGQWHEQEMQRSLDAAKAVVDSDINLLNADIALINAKASVYQTDAQVYKTQIDAEVAKLEQYRLQIQSEGLDIQDNETQIRLYGARLNALDQTIKEYNANLAAKNLENEVMRSKIQVQAQEINRFNALVQEQVAKFQNYKIKNEDEGLKLGAYETSVRAYAETVKAYSAQVDAAVKEAGVNNDINKVSIAKYAEDIRLYSSSVSARAEAYRSQAAILSELVKAGQVEADAKYKSAQIGVENDRNYVNSLDAIARTNIANAEAHARAAEASAQLAMEKERDLIDIYAGLTGSIYSALNVSASEGRSISGSISDGVRYDGGAV